VGKLTQLPFVAPKTRPQQIRGGFLRGLAPAMEDDILDGRSVKRRDHGWQQMQHRQFLAHSEAYRPLVGGDFFARIGGNATIETLIDGLYDRIEADAALRPLFGRDIASEREAQKRFFTEWLGGERNYSSCAYLPLKHRHDLLPITRALASRWLAHFRGSLDIAVSDVDARRVIFEKTRVVAMALINEREPRSALRAQPHGTCLRYEPSGEALDLARRGDSAGLSELLTRAPEVLASAPLSASLLRLAVLAGRGPVVELLLGNGVDVNKPSPVEPLILITPLCAARVKRRKDIEAMLIRHGAKEDIFTHALLGNLESLADDLAREPTSAQANDPAVDALEITPVHHAVAGGRVKALQLLLSHVSQANESLCGGKRAIGMAVAHEDVAAVATLLAHGSDATTIGAGRWVLHPDLEPMLARAGACVDRSGSWIQLSCTGNQGRKDDPEYVAALLRHGARVDDKRLTVQMTDGGRATALHYAVKAGFVKTIEVLLDHGADPAARDDNGCTPLDWLARAPKSVDRDAVRRLLRHPRE
jgi:truncated hemoglobin YjbI/ankyrin repeat protein